MLSVRHALGRAVYSAASSVATRNARTIVTAVNVSRVPSCSARLGRPQRFSVIVNGLRRAYSTEEKSAASMETSEKVSENAGDAQRPPVETEGASEMPTAEEAVQSAREAVSSAAETATETAKDFYDRAANAVGMEGSNRGDRPVISLDPLKVYIGNLAFHIQDDTLKEDFSRFGNVTNHYLVRDDRGLSKGFGYVVFEDEESAKNAIESTNGQIYNGRTIVTKPANVRERPSRPHREANPMDEVPSKQLYIGNIPYAMTDDEFNDAFGQVKGVKDVRVAIDRRTGLPRGFAHAEFESVEMAEAAREILGGMKPHGRDLRVSFSHNKK